MFAMPTGRTYSILDGFEFGQTSHEFKVANSRQMFKTNVPQPSVPKPELRFNLLSVSQLLDDGYETRFKKNACRVLDSAGELVFGISRVGRIFGADFSESLAGSLKCLMTSSSEFWLWHRRLGHIGFDHLTRVSNLDLMRGLPKLKVVKDAVCAPCRHGKKLPPHTLL